MHHQPAVRVTPKDTFYRIEEPVTGLCVRLHCEPAPAGDAPRIVAKLAPGAIATWFVTRPQAEEAFVLYTPGQALEIARFDA